MKDRKKGRSDEKKDGQRRRLLRVRLYFLDAEGSFASPSPLTTPPETGKMHVKEIRKREMAKKMVKKKRRERRGAKEDEQVKRRRR